MIVDLVGEFPARQRDLLGIDDHHEIPRVGVGREDGLVLAAEAVGDLPGEPAQDLSLRIDEEPLAVDGILLCHKRTHGCTNPVKFENVKIGE